MLAFGSVATAFPSTIQLREDDIVLYGKGRYQIMKRDDFTELQQARQNGTIPPMPGYLDTSLIHSPDNSTTDGTNTRRSIKKRGSETIIIPNAPQRFLGWDVQMSQVTKGAPTTITVSSGYDISNSISVGTSASFTLVKDFLEASVSIDYSTSWTSSQSQQFTAEIPVGKYGAFVSNPWTNRQSGNIFEGAIGSEGTLTYYQGDSFDSKSFDQMNWVDGVISLCTGDAFPLPRCLGEGTL
ncbi:hypothetical protein N0V90_003830 [Kalmusia sp. IMI 367209]|nr:hypothetical protein N0V90_003830 [Kalmusia sp. IMI 367209]